MDEQRFDDAPRAFAAPATRRRALLAALGLGAAGVTAAFRARHGSVAIAQPTCQAEGAPCSIWVGCCGDLTCVGAAMNPNNGVCVAGGPTRVPSTQAPRGGTRSSRKARTTSKPNPAGVSDNSGFETTPTPISTAATKPTKSPRPTATSKSTKTPRPTATSKPTKTPNPTQEPREEEKDAISIELKCNGDPEVIRITNNTERTIKIRSLRTLGTPPQALGAGNDPWNFTPGRDNPSTSYQEVQPGKPLIFVSGQNAQDTGSHNRLAGVKIFSKAREEGISLDTLKNGTFRSFCDNQLNQGDAESRSGQGRGKR